MYYDEGSCVECPDSATVAGILAGLLVVLILIFTALLWLSTHFTGASKRQKVQYLLARVHKVSRQAQTIGVQATVKIVLNFGQVRSRRNANPHFVRTNWTRAHDSKSHYPTCPMSLRVGCCVHSASVRS
jgi:hypothetical protein|eukprot:831063-Prymnesium_polylepis.2